MTIFRKIISASLSPNTDKRDVLEAFKALCKPVNWKVGSDVDYVEEWFSKKYKGVAAASFNSGRSALLGILKAFQIGSGDEVLVQSFTCVAVPNSVLWAGAKPIYVDIDATLNIDIADASKKVSPKCKAIIVQHTLGIPANLERIKSFADKNHLLLIEDCAHALGGTYKGKLLGSYGDAAFFSFGRDKIVSSVFGGLAVISKLHPNESKNLRVYRDALVSPGNFWIFQQLLHPLIFAIVLPVYRTGFGKAILFAFQKLRLLSFPVYPEEKMGLRPKDFPKKYPNALAFILRNQLGKLPVLNIHRREIAQFYRDSLTKTKNVKVLSLPSESIYLRFPILTEEPLLLAKEAKKRGILLGNWYHNVIDPMGVDFKKVFYEFNSCPKAEDTAKHILNLPTNISTEDAREVIRLFL